MYKKIKQKVQSVQYIFSLPLLTVFPLIIMHWYGMFLTMDSKILINYEPNLWFTLRLTVLYSFMNFDNQINIVIYLPLQYPTE